MARLADPIPRRLFQSTEQHSILMDINREIIAILGIKMKRVDSACVDRLIRRGFPHSSLTRVMKVLGISKEELTSALGMKSETERSAALRGGRLSLLESDRLYRIVRILALATELFRGKKAAAEWLREPVFGLGGKTPFDALLTEPGALEVENLLGRIQHGVIS